MEKVTDYIGNFVYENSSLTYILTDEGRLVPDSSGFAYEYFIKDHLGNTRLVVKDSSGTATVMSEAHYYPFGLRISGLSFDNTMPENKYLYNGKELQDDFGLGWYDYGARFYDVELGRWHSIDPLTEKYFSISPYIYVVNNPINAIDPDGKDTINAIKNSFAFKVFNHTKKGRTFINNFVNGKYKDHTLILKKYDGYKDGYVSTKVVDGKIEITIAIDGTRSVDGVETLGHEAFVHAERKIKEIDKVLDNNSLSESSKSKKISEIQKSSNIFYNGKQVEFSGDVDHAKMVNGTAYSYFKYIGQAGFILSKISPERKEELYRLKNESVKQYRNDKWIQWYLKIGNYKYRK